MLSRIRNHVHILEPSRFVHADSLECELMLQYNNHKDNIGQLTGSIDECDKARELLNLFSGVPLDDIQAMFASNAGLLAYAVLCNQTDTGIVRGLIDELQGEYLSSESLKPFITRQAMLNELEDILKAKTITPYRRSRINKALKRDCIACHGSGKQPRKIEQSRGLLGERRVKHEIDSRSPDCTHCQGTGRKDIKTGVIVEITEE